MSMNPPRKLTKTEQVQQAVQRTLFGRSELVIAAIALITGFVLGKL